MGALTEREIFACLAENLRLAAQHCDDIATTPDHRPVYRLLANELKLVEGCCRQASAWREDTRWLNIGLTIADAHKKAGNWLRGFRTEQGQKITLAPAHRKQLFQTLAANLRAIWKVAETFRTGRPPRLGMILPKPMPVSSALFDLRRRGVQVMLPDRISMAMPPGRITGVSPGGIITSVRNDSIA